MLNDPDKHVRNTSSWCIERVAELFPEVLVLDNNLQVFIECFLSHLKSSNKIVVHLCNALHYLCSSLKPHEDQVSCIITNVNLNLIFFSSSFSIHGCSSE